MPSSPLAKAMVLFYSSCCTGIFQQEWQNPPRASFGSCLALVYGVKAAGAERAPAICVVFSAAGGIQRKTCWGLGWFGSFCVYFGFFCVTFNIAASETSRSAMGLEPWRCEGRLQPSHQHCSHLAALLPNFYSN